MYKYTLCFIKKDNQVLMINRNKSPWMGCWNGLGGKIENNENPIQSIKRELFEEANIDESFYNLKFKGIVTWNEEEFGFDGGLYLFIAELIKDINYSYPRKTREGILDFKDIEWVISEENYGMSHNIKYFLPTALNSDILKEYNCYFENKILKKVDVKLIANDYYKKISY